MTTFATEIHNIMINFRTLRLLIPLAICSLCIQLNAQTDSVYDGTVHYFWTGDGNHVRYGLMDTAGNVICRQSFSQIGAPFHCMLLLKANWRRQSITPRTKRYTFPGFWKTDGSPFPTTEPKTPSARTLLAERIGSSTLQRVERRIKQSCIRSSTPLKRTA